MGCSYCGKAGCGWDTCEERLEDYHGTPADHDEESYDESHWVDYREETNE